jgi:hypothetical protein
LAAAVLSLAWLAPVGWSADVAQQSRIVRIELDHPAAPALADLEAAATAAGLRCRPVMHAVHGHHAPPPARGLQCTAPEGPGFFEAFVSPHPEQMLIKIYAAAETTPHGEVDPVIERVLQAYKQTLIDGHNLKSLLECLAPDADACLRDST